MKTDQSHYTTDFLEVHVVPETPCPTRDLYWWIWTHELVEVLSACLNIFQAVFWAGSNVWIKTSCLYSAELVKLVAFVFQQEGEQFTLPGCKMNLGAPKAFFKASTHYTLEVGLTGAWG